MSIPLASSRLSSRTRPTSWLSPTSRLPIKASAAPAPRSSRLPTPPASQTDTSKGKGRAILPVAGRPTLLERWRASSAERQRHHDDPLHTRPDNIMKSSAPTAYFSANRANQARDEPVASTSASHPLQDFVENGKLPQTALRLEQLIETAFEQEREDVLEKVLESCRTDTQDAKLETQALVHTLGLPIQRPYHAHLEKMNRRTRRAFKKDVSQDNNSLLSQGLFFTAWQRLWEIDGEELYISADLAGHVLQILIALPLEAGSGMGADAAFGTRALRHLLFLAGIEENHSLALDLLAHTIAPHAFSAEPHASVIPKAKATASVDEVVLILQDLLRSGIIRSETVQEFDLSSVVSKSLELPSARFATLLQQVLLRILVRCYVDSYQHDRSSLLLRYLDTIERDTIVDREKDRSLAVSVCEAALRASEGDGRWVGRIAVLLTLALQGKLSFWSPEHIPRRLLAQYFDTALPTKRREHASIRSKYTSAALLWKALDQITAGTSWIPLVHLAEIMRALSQPLHKHAQRTLQDFYPEYTEGSDARSRDFLKIARRVREDLKSGPEGQVTSSEANAILRTLLSSKTSSPSSSAIPESVKLESSILRITEQIYQLFTSSPFTTSDPFILDTRNLVPLVKTMARLPDPNVRAEHGINRLEEAGNAIRVFLREKKSRHGQIQPIELTTAARSFFLIGDREAGIAVLGQLLKNKQVPDPVDIRVLLVDLVQEDPGMTAAILGEALDMGLTPDQDTLWTVMLACEKHQPEQTGTIVAVVRAHREKIKNGEGLARQMQDYVERSRIGTTSADAVARADELVRLLKDSVSGETSVSRQTQVTASLVQLLRHRRYSPCKDLLEAAVQRSLVGTEVIQAFLSTVPSRPNKASRRKLTRSGRRSLLLPITHTLQANPTVLQEGGSESSIYSKMRRACLFFEDAEAARVVHDAGVQAGMTLNPDDMEVFKEILSGKTVSQRSKYLFHEELDSFQSFNVSK